MEFQFAKRLDTLQAGIFNVLDEKGKQMEQTGHKVYNLSIGTPDFQPEPHVMQALAQAALEPANYRYALSEQPELLQAVQDWYARRYQVELEPEEISRLTEISQKPVSMGNAEQAMSDYIEKNRMQRLKKTAPDDLAAAAELIRRKKGYGG